jgi:uncharacterized protein
MTTAMVSARNFMDAIVSKFSVASIRWASRVLKACVVACMLQALSGCAWLALKERELVFRATPGRPAAFAGLRPGDTAFAVAVPSTSTLTPDQQDRLQLWWLPHADPSAPALLYLHGTFRNLYQNLQKIDALREAGFAVLAVDYRGWGDSTPIVPSEASIYADAEAAWSALTQRQPDPHRRVIYGHSMGGGVAIELAHRKHVGADYAALVVESTFTRWRDVGAAAGVLGSVLSRLSSQHFDSVDKIGQVDAPILMLHGSADTTVPITLGRELRDAAPAGTRLVEIAGGSHSGLNSDAPEAYQQALRALISQLR